MRLSWQILVWLVALIGILLVGMLGTSTAMTFIWPAYVMLGLAGALTVGLVFQSTTFTPPRGPLITVFLLFGYLVLRGLESPVRYFAREDLALAGACFITYCVFLSGFNSRNSRLSLIAVVALLLLINLGFALAQKLGDASLWLLPGYERTITHRVGGLFNHPDHFAAFVAVLSPLWLSLALFSRLGKWLRRASWLLAGSSALMVLSLGTAPAIAAMLAGIAVVAILLAMMQRHHWSQHHKTVLVGGLSLGLILATIMMLTNTQSLQGKIRQSFLTKEGQVTLPETWASGIQQFLLQPAIGTGSRTSYLYSRQFRSPDLADSVSETEFAHNEWIQLLADYGILGLVLLLALLTVHIRSGWQFARGYAGGYRPFGGITPPKSDHLALVVGALALLSSISVYSLFDFVLHLPVFAVLVAAVLALLAAPDPMANILQEKDVTVVPGGTLMFSKRILTFGVGLATMFYGCFFTVSEYHYEKARLAFERDNYQFEQFRHLHLARRLDPKNPFALALSAHAQVAKITPGMSDAARAQALEQADRYFNEAQSLYPQDVFAAIGHVAVLDELGKKERASERLEAIKVWAPLYGNIAVAEAEHHLRYAEIAQAETAFTAALTAPAFPEHELAEQGLSTISDWKLIAQQNGIRWDTPSEKNTPETDDAPTSPAERSLLDANKEERAVAGEVDETTDFRQPPSGELPPSRGTVETPITTPEASNESTATEQGPVEQFPRLAPSTEIPDIPEPE